MGLDNSIEIKRTAYTDTIPELKRFELSYDTKHEYDFECAYWRKCYGLRGDIIDLVGAKWRNALACVLDKNDIDNIIILLNSYTSETWLDSIWDWNDEEYPYSEKIQRDIENLKYLRELMDKYELEVYFYDSY